MGPKIVVLYGGYAFERVRNLLNAMVNFPDLHSFGQVMVELMVGGKDLSPNQQEPLLERYLQRFTLQGTDDPEFDRRIIFEALTFGAKMFRLAWQEQVQAPGLSYESYQFHRWLGSDLVLERRSTL